MLCDKITFEQSIDAVAKNITVMLNDEGSKKNENVKPVNHKAQILTDHILT